MSALLTTAALCSGRTEQEIAEEIGDVLWYCAELASGINRSLDEIAEMNIEKLRKRYPDGFDSERSVHRAEYEVIEK